MELWDIYDKNRELTGKTRQRREKFEENEYHLSVQVWIINSNKELLISKRAPNKLFPNMWECTGGAVITGENSLQGALREVEEELGIKLCGTKGKIVFSQRRDELLFPDFLDVWLFEEDIDINHIKLGINEVEDAKWAKKEEIKSMIDKGEFLSWFDYLDDLFKYIDEN